MKRFFEFLLPERTHLKAVIAALVAIFALSGVLAFQALQGEKSRDELEQQHLQAFQRMTLQGAVDYFNHGVFGNLLSMSQPAVTVSNKGGSLADIAQALDMRALCGGCAGTANLHTVYAIDLNKPVPPSGLPLELRSNLQSLQLADLTYHWWVGIFSVANSAGDSSYAVVRNTKGSIDRAWVVPIPREYVRHALAAVSTTKFLPDELTHGVPTDSLFRIDVADPVLGRMLSTTSAPAVAPPATAVSNQPFFPGMKWTMGVLPRGVETFVPQRSPWSSPNLLFAMMALIAAVIFMAIALVRREEELHRLRSDLISGVSHELRTPLAQIRMFAETLLLGRTRTPAETRRSLEVIDQEAKRLSHFVENMLQFAKGEGGRTRLAPEPTSFAVEVRRAVESFAPMCQSRGVEVRTELEDGVTAPVDRSALRRIMLNLMENALKYGPDEQRITVGIAIFNDVVRLWVDDEGEGIPRADRERVFDSFFRLSRELDRRITGSGIGLAVVRQLATLHGGRAWAEEAPGGGARLVVEFPDAYVRPHEEGTGWAVA